MEEIFSGAQETLAKLGGAPSSAIAVPQPESILEQLMRQQAILETKLATVKAAREALERNPENADTFVKVSKALNILRY